MSIENPFTILNFNDAEEALYKLLIQLCSIPRSHSKSIYHKIKVTDLVDVSKYSKPKIYEVIRRLEEKELIQIDNTRPMFLKPREPKIAIKEWVETRKKLLDENVAKIIHELDSLPKMSAKYPFSNVPPFNFINGIEEYHKLIRNMLISAKNSIILIIGYLIKNEEEILREYIGKKLREGIGIRILYGGSPKFKIFFKRNVLIPNKLSENQTKGKIDIKAINFAPPIRMTIVDDRELIMTLIKGSARDIKINITDVSALHSDNESLIEYARRTYTLLRPTADRRLAEAFKA